MAAPENGMIKGHGLVLITGKKGSGKSHFATWNIKYLRDNFPEHPVYADIEGINIDGVERSPEDWQELPDNCTVFYDEAQRLEWCDNSSSRINSDPRIREMTMIRHRNINIVVMTQDPTFVHSALRKLVDTHYHISHPFKDGKPKVFKFAGAMSTIDDKGAYRTYAVETFTHKLDKDTSALYKSVDDGAKHDQKRKIPKRIIYMGIFVVLLILFAIPAGIWGVSKAYNFISGAKNQGNEMATKAEEVKKGETPVSEVTGASGFTHPQMDAEQLSKEQLEELYAKYLDDYTREVAEHDAIRPDSIIAMGSKCMAFNRFGDSLNISQDKCFDMLANPDTIPKKRVAALAAASAARAPQSSNEPPQDFVNNPPPPLPNS